MNKKPSIAIIGAGIGGLTLASTLRRAGFEARIYEQAGKFTRLGAGIQMSPNAMKVLRGIGLEERMCNIAFEPESMTSRDWDTGKITNDYRYHGIVQERYGAPYLLLHRGDLHLALASIVPTEQVHLQKQLINLDQTGPRVVLKFADGSNAEADIVIGADGVHSKVREILFGHDDPTYVGRVAYRTTFPASLIGQDIFDNTKWWGPDRHIVIYYITRNKDEVYFVTSVPEERTQRESWSQIGNLNELRAAFTGFHPQVTRVLEACPAVHKWGIFVRDPLPSWSSGRVALLGDSCHPMTPYMAQGAATSMEDAVVLTRCLQEERDIESALHRYELARKPRTSMIQAMSKANTWMRQNTDADQVFGYDPWTAPLPASQKQPSATSASRDTAASAIS